MLAWNVDPPDAASSLILFVPFIRLTDNSPVFRQPLVQLPVLPTFHWLCIYLPFTVTLNLESLFAQ